jgi:dCTP deaminase
MFLSHITIEQYIEQKKIIIGPAFDKKNMRPIGIRLHLGKYVLIAEPNQYVDLTERSCPKYKEVDIEQHAFVLEPEQFVLGSTYESIHISNDIAAILDGRSTIARLGLTTHITASVIDGAYEGPHCPTLEIKNVGNFRIRLKYKDPIAMMLFVELKDFVMQPQQSQYSSTLDKVAPPNLNFKTGWDTK